MRPLDGPPGGAVPHVFVADVARPELDDDDQRHLERVLRVRSGDPVTVSDGNGRWRACRYGRPPEPDGPIQETARPSPVVGVGFALVKGARPELVVQKLTELGVDRITPFQAARSVVRWDEARSERNAARLRRIAREAAMQSRRCWLPVVDEPQPWSAVSTMAGAARCDRDGRPPTLDHPVLLVGPEGGWADAERTDLPASVMLAPTILRAETAAVVAGAVLVALRAGLVRTGEA